MRKPTVGLLAGAMLAAALYLAPEASAQTVCATIYEHIDFGGSSRNISPGESSANIGTLWNDKASSLRVTPGCGFNGWQHADYRGTHKSFVGTVPWIGDGWNDILSSYTCTCP